MKPAAKELMKNKSAMARVRNERLFQNVMTRRSDMTKAGNRRKPEMLKLNKKKLAVKPNNNNQNKKETNSMVKRLSLPGLGTRIGRK